MTTVERLQKLGIDPYTERVVERLLDLLAEKTAEVEKLKSAYVLSAA